MRRTWSPHVLFLINESSYCNIEQTAFTMLFAVASIYVKNQCKLQRNNNMWGMSGGVIFF